MSKSIGRGANVNPPNRFERLHVESDVEQLSDEDVLDDSSAASTEYFVDESKTIVSENDSPDVNFRWSVNPYRGCMHGCSYCYARPTHEYLGFNAGIDFESKVMVKTRAPDLLRDWLARSDWTGESITFSGVTDCYQPAERHFRITRGCLEVCLEARQPVSIITKNALVTRDIDLLKEMTEWNLVNVALSVTTLDKDLARVMEPRTSIPQSRLRAIQELSGAGIPVHVMAAPIVPGLNDSEIPAILREVGNAGASTTSFILLRLPLNVEPIFMEWLERTQGDARSRIESRIRATRDGQLSDSQYGRRMRGEGEIAKQIENTFRVFAKKFGLNKKFKPLDSSNFRPPTSSSGQQHLF